MQKNGFLRISFLSLILVTLCSQNLLASDPKKEAKENFQAGLDLLTVEDFGGAKVHFERSVKLYPTKNGLFNLANCYKALHEYGKALDTIGQLETTFKGKLSDKWTTEIKRFKTTLLKLVATLAITVSEDGATITVDGRPVGTSPLEKPLIMGPGTYHFKVELAGFHPIEKEVNLFAQGSTTEWFELEAVPVLLPPPVVAPEEPASEQDQEHEDSASTSKRRLKVLFWTSLGLTVATVATSGIFYGVAGSRNKDFEAAADDFVATDEAWQSDPSNATLQEEADAAYQTMVDEQQAVKKFQTLGLTFAITAGAFAVTTVILGIKAKKAGGKTNDGVAFAPAPGGLLATW